MAYSIKHVHLLENSPFKKISTYNKTMNDNDGEWIDRMQKRIDTYRIDSVKTRLIENFIYNFSEQLDRSKRNFIKTFKDQNTVLDYLDSDMISFYLGNSNNEENDNLENLEICSKSENALHSCYILKNNVKPVIRIIENQEIEYPSISEAARQLKVTDGAIRYALKNNSKCCKCYWKYK